MKQFKNQQKQNVMKTNLKNAKVNETVKNANEKKPYVMPQSVKAITEANKEIKNDLFSLSGLCRYAQSEKGEAIILTYCKKINLDFNVKQVTVKFLKDNNKPERFFNKDGNKKETFSHWLILCAIRSHAKKQSEAKK